ncbi:hypothetical protein HK099_000363 [Clydaea vesicula]|uniref:HIG1 domain-containing protein n=1 Tax=Clydaea vesicula TaxID=447962 RepID=A0AAD5TV71_9FUNG|nr:hypothetical protein HK099_000363 [Clydaea vesicula]
MNANNEDKNKLSIDTPLDDFSVYSQKERRAAHLERKRAGDEIHNEVVRQGLESAAIWTTGAAAISLYLHQSRRSALYNNVRPAYKIFLVTLVGTAAFFTRTDISSMNEDRKFSAQYSIHKPSEQALEEGVDISTPFSWTKEGIKASLLRNRYALVGDINTSQKVINSRMTAQSAVLLGLAAFAGVSAMNVAPPKNISIESKRY